ncbi:BCCT family transporter [Thioclava sp. GXIMD4216]|uniref:BCCT family transporter n=1 Tax=Thioclava litoralis TaxID=3076557 RepID=A0ABZ1E091_9RHOB|nr:BCCT family transporter [Thioclava sp. FTW29]
MAETIDQDEDLGVPAPEGDAAPIDTDYSVGQDNIEGSVGRLDFDIHNPVFAISAVAVVLFVLFTLVFPQTAQSLFSWLFSSVTGGFDWFFLSAGDIFVLFSLFLIVSPWGKVRLGGSEATPDFGYPAWFAMLFAAGMGIGLMFYGVGEPLTHFSTSFAGAAGAPLGGAQGDTEAAFKLGMAATIYHWALHPWAIYAVLALALALFSYNKGLPLTIRSAFYPILGERIWGWPGHIIDILAVFATLFGLATSLGLGATQANAGLHAVLGIPISTTVQVILIICITAVALVSVLRGLEGGVQKLSEINMILALVLLLFVLFTGPTLTLLGDIGTGLGAYLTELPALSNPFGREDTRFVQGWTSYYWAWWISWSPFVGMFIARVSRGRTVREFVVCVLLIPSLACVVWMSIFGGVALQQVIQDGYQAAVDADISVKLFRVLEALPLSQITSVVGVILVIVFFVTSSDSGSLVIDTITAGGKVNAPVPQRVFWATFEGVVAIVLLLGGGLSALQSMVISTGLPFTVVLLVMCYSIVKGLQAEKNA